MATPKQPKTFVSVVVIHADRVLLVQEAKPDVRGLWNLPGGHLELGETVTVGAVREVREETGLFVKPSSLVGVYSCPRWIRFVLRAEVGDDAVVGAAAGDEILAVRWATLDEAASIPDEELSAAGNFRMIMGDVQSGASYPLALLREFE